MLDAISRFGVRVLPNTQQIVADCRSRRQFVQGPLIAEFEEQFARRLGRGKAIATSYGRMAFYYILKAFDFPPGAEIIFPAFTFWVIPEMARVAGLKIVFADIDPATFNLDPESFEKAITPKTRAVVPTHLYGLPCEMDAILAIAKKNGLAVIEDCAHSLGASYHGQPVGTMGDAALFSFQTLKPLNTYGGGMAVVQDSRRAERVSQLAAAEPWPEEQHVQNLLWKGRAQRIFTRPPWFGLSAFPVLWIASWFKARPDVYLWEAIRPLNPLPASYTLRYSNVQAALGLAGLELLDHWTRETQAHARIMDQALGDIPGVIIPSVPPDQTHVYYQYSAYVPDRDELVRKAIRRGVDIETLHADVCAGLPLFHSSRRSAPGADRAATAVQLPVYALLSGEQVLHAGNIVRQILLSSFRNR
jgi:perosamine synthetase